MRLPWLQVEQEAFERAIELSALLAIGEAQAMGHLVWLWRWALSRPADEELTGKVVGHTAEIQIEAGARWRGEPGKFLGALQDLGLADETDAECGDQRIKGLDRYRKVLEERLKESQRVADYREKRTRTEPVRTRTVPVQNANIPVRTPSELDAESDADAELKEEEEEAKPPSSKLTPPLPVNPTDPLVSAEAFFAKAQHLRAAHNLTTERLPHPRALSTWWSEVHMELKGDLKRLPAAYERFTDNAYWRDKAPPWPWQAFTKNWRDYVR